MYGLLSFYDMLCILCPCFFFFSSCLLLQVLYFLLLPTPTPGNLEKSIVCFSNAHCTFAEKEVSTLIISPTSSFTLSPAFCGYPREHIFPLCYQRDIRYKTISNVSKSITLVLEKQLSQLFKCRLHIWIHWVFTTSPIIYITSLIHYLSDSSLENLSSGIFGNVLMKVLHVNGNITAYRIPGSNF